MIWPSFVRSNTRGENGGTTFADLRSPLHAANSRGRGFTLIELLVAMTMAIIIVGLLASMVSQGMAVHQRTVSRLVTEIDAAVALDLLAKDLESLAVVTRRDFERLQSFPEKVTPGDLEANQTWLMVLSDPTDSDAATGQTRAISYRIRYQDPITLGGPKPVYALYRAVKDANETFTRAIGKKNLQLDYWNVAGVTSASEADFLVGNVVGFQVTFWARQGASNVLTRIPPDKIVRLSGGNYAIGDPPVVQPGRIVQAEISLTLLTPDGATRVQSGGLPLKEALAKFSHTYSRTVNLRAQKL